MENIFVKNSLKHGKGAYAARDFKKGEIVISWENEKILTKSELQKLPENEKRYVSKIEDKYIYFSEPARCVNHSCNPNTTPSNFANIALRNIKKGEEITTDYDLEGALEQFKCNCSSENCRIFIGSNKN